MSNKYAAFKDSDWLFDFHSGTDDLEAALEVAKQADPSVTRVELIRSERESGR